MYCRHELIDSSEEDREEALTGNGPEKVGNERKRLRQSNGLSIYVYSLFCNRT